MYVRTYVRTYARTHVRMYLCMYVCVYIYIYIYIQNVVPEEAVGAAGGLRARETPVTRGLVVSATYGRFPKFHRVFWAETLAH